MLAMVTALHKAGVTASSLATALPRSRFLSVARTLTGEELAAAFVNAYPGSHKRLGRWFIDAPLYDDGKTWVLSKMWGTNTEPVLERLLTLASSAEFGYEAAEDG
jgi:hypothetical protein